MTHGSKNDPLPNVQYGYIKYQLDQSISCKICEIGFRTKLVLDMSTF